MSQSQVQSVLFDNSSWSIEKAANWVVNHGFKAPKVDVTQHLLRFRQIDPATLRRKGYQKYRTHPIGEGISFVLAYK